MAIENTLNSSHVAGHQSHMRLVHSKKCIFIMFWSPSRAVAYAIDNISCTRSQFMLRVLEYKFFNEKNASRNLQEIFFQMGYSKIRRTSFERSQGIFIAKNGLVKFCLTFLCKMIYFFSTESMKVCGNCFNVIVKIVF